MPQKKTTNDKVNDVFKAFSHYAQPAVPADFGNGRYGWLVTLFGPNKNVIGWLRLIEREEDGEYSVTFELAPVVEQSLGKAGVKVHKRAKPTRKTLSVAQMPRMA